jgi:protein involved in polysaccharide export with SLBB domain
MAWFRHRSWRWGAPMLVACALLACSGEPRSVVPAAAPGGGEAAVTAIEAGGEVGVAGYRLGPGDQVRLTVFRHEDLSGQFEVDGEGFFALPLVGEILSAGMTARELEGEIESRLKGGGYLVSPQVSIEVLNYRPFYIVGEINNPGSYQYVSGMTVTNAVALAGGFSYRAAEDAISIRRGGSAARQIDAHLDSGVLPGDIIKVPERFF